jgi:hypothetical protein
MAADRAVAFAESNPTADLPTVVGGMSRSYFGCRSNHVRWGVTNCIPMSKKMKNFKKRTCDKKTFNEGISRRRRHGEKPYQALASRTGGLAATEPEPELVVMARPLKVYLAYKGWTDLPEIELGHGYIAMGTDDHGRGVAEADLVILGKLADLESSTHAKAARHLLIPCVVRYHGMIAADRCK